MDSSPTFFNLLLLQFAYCLDPLILILMSAGASEMESRLNAIWKMDHPMYRAYGNTMKTYDLAAKMAGCRGQSSYFVLRGLLSVPAELMARGLFRSTEDLLKEVPDMIPELHSSKSEPSRECLLP